MAFDGKVQVSCQKVHRDARNKSLVQRRCQQSLLYSPRLNRNHNDAYRHFAHGACRCKRMGTRHNGSTFEYASQKNTNSVKQIYSIFYARNALYFVQCFYVYGRFRGAFQRKLSRIIFRKRTVFVHIFRNRTFDFDCFKKPIFGKSSCNRNRLFACIDVVWTGVSD